MSISNAQNAKELISRKVKELNDLIEKHNQDVCVNLLISESTSLSCLVIKASFSIKV